MKEIFNRLVQEMGKHSINEYPREACGIITKDFKYIPCKNLSRFPKNSFVLDPISLFEYEDNTFGIYHSHPGSNNPLPSEEDMQHTIFDEYKFFVGFANKIFIYFFSKKLNILIYEPFEEKHLKNGNN